jgi:hypothetical protein
MISVWSAGAQLPLFRKGGSSALPHSKELRSPSDTPTSVASIKTLKFPARLIWNLESVGLDLGQAGNILDL